MKKLASDSNASRSSWRVFPLLGLVTVAFGAVGYGCGGGSSSSDPVALCKQGCDKYITLCPDQLQGIDAATAKAFCESACTSSAGNSGETCTNASAIESAYKTCLSKTTCADLMACEDAIPECQGGSSTGTGGTSGAGTGGTTGGAGTGGTTGGTGTGGTTGGGTGGAGGSGDVGPNCTALKACCDAQMNPQLATTCQAALTAGETTCAQVLASLSTLCP